MRSFEGGWGLSGMAGVGRIMTRGDRTCLHTRSMAPDCFVIAIQERLFMENIYDNHASVP